MMKCKNKSGYGGLSLILTSIVFIIIFSTMCIIGVIISFLYNNNLFSPIEGSKPLYILIFMAILSIIICSVLTFIFSKIPLKPINKLITATKELSNGNFDISEQIRQSILLLEPKWSNKDIEINIYLDETSYIGNEELLKQVWINLIDNSIKFIN